LRTLAEKHVCGKKTREPRKGWRMDPGKKLERQKAAAIRRFEQRTSRGQEPPIPDDAVHSMAIDRIDAQGSGTDAISEPAPDALS